MVDKNSADDERELEDDEDSDREGADKENADNAGEEEKVDGEDEKDEEPKVRRNLSHIIARKNRQIEKLKSRKYEEDEEEEDDGEGVEEKVGKAVRKSIEPIAKNLDEQQVGLEISTFLADPKNAKFKRYERQARRYALHPAYENVPIDGIFKQLAFDDVDSGQNESRLKERAQRQNTRGSSFRKPPESYASKIRQMQFRDKGFQEIRNRIGAGETINLAEEE